MKNQKLKTVIAVGLIAGILIPTVISGWYTLKKQHGFLMEKQEEHHARITNLLALMMEEPVWTMVPEKGQILVDAIMTDPGIVRVLITSEEGPFIEKHGAGGEFEQTLTLTRPILFHSQKLGEVLVTVDTRQTRATMIRQTIDFFIITMIQFLSSLLILFFLLNIKVLKPVQRLIGQSRSLALKVLHEPFHWDQRDEMGILGQSFEETRQSLVSLFDTLKKKNSIGTPCERTGFSQRSRRGCQPGQE